MNIDERIKNGRACVKSTNRHENFSGKCQSMNLVKLIKNYINYCKTSRNSHTFVHE